ncbi:MAG: site-specific DNA-methyltransferase [Methylophilaceae bacterium]
MHANAPHAAPPLAIEHLALDRILPDPRNPRLHSKRQIRQVANSIESFGHLVPALVDGEGRLIAGHARLRACQLLQRAQMPVIRIEHLTPEQVRAYMIADNRLAENATWNDQLLAEAFQDLLAVDLDFSIETTGFDLAEIDLRIETLQAPTPEPPVEPPHAIAISRPGDLWLLGDHRVLCGNALVEADYQAVCGPAIADLVFTDPPYNVPIAGHVSGNGSIRHRDFAMACGEMSTAQFTAFLTSFFQLTWQFSRDGSIHYVCMDWRHLGETLAAGAAVGAELKNLCVWDKGAAGMGSLYRSQHELVLVFKHGSAAHINNVQLGRYGRHRSNVWRYPGVNSFARSTDEGNLLELHPTVKPVALVQDALLDCSHRGDTVLDPFLGAGSTLIAAERAGRRCCGIELDPRYVDVAIRRWQKHTGHDAVHAASGETFRARQAHIEEDGHA